MPPTSTQSGAPATCFYCHRAIGTGHLTSSVVPDRTVLVKVTLTIPLEVAQNLRQGAVGVCSREGTWCADPFVEELAEVVCELHEAGACLRGRTDLVTVSSQRRRPGRERPGPGGRRRRRSLRVSEGAGRSPAPAPEAKEGQALMGSDLPSHDA